MRARHARNHPPRNAQSPNQKHCARFARDLRPGSTTGRHPAGRNNRERTDVHARVLRRSGPPRGRVVHGRLMSRRFQTNRSQSPLEKTSRRQIVRSALFFATPSVSTQRANRVETGVDICLRYGQTVRSGLWWRGVHLFNSESATPVFYGRLQKETSSAITCTVRLLRRKQVQNSRRLWQTS
jgi:hypothetical protein